ncbi:S9 family peptidase [Flavobacterium notoginsengisoli]|uniref:S9 family peptidase n=1 Tax=Flavobacterium notoginsengisoli TaxID=1478199 RepID=UPI00362E1A55
MHTLYKSNQLLFRIPALVLFSILFLVACPIRGQAVLKKQLSSSDYDLWGSLEVDRISPNENWTSYRMTYENGADTLFVKNTVTNKVYEFPSVRQTIFTRNNYFIYHSKDSIHIFDPESNREESFPASQNYNYSQITDLLIIEDVQENKLLIKIPFGKILRKISHAKNYSVSPDSHSLIYITFYNGINSAQIVDLRKINSTKTITKGSNSFENFKWSNNSKAVAFYSKSDAYSIKSLFFLALQPEKLFELNPAMDVTIPNDMILADKYGDALVVADNAKMLFFNAAAKSSASNVPESKVEIWNTNDKWIYPDEQSRGNFNKKQKIMLWQPYSRSISAISSDSLPKVILTGNYEHAILSNPKDYEPQFDFQGPRDFYIMDVKNGCKELLLKKQSAIYWDLVPSPLGRYIAYYREKNWWIYDIATKSHTNITLKTGVSFQGKIRTFEYNTTFGNPAWSKADKEILLYDEFDIWAITPDGKYVRRLTKGRESKIKFRIAKIPSKNVLAFTYSGLVIPNIDIEKEFLLQAEGDDGKTGFFRWNKKTGEEPIVFRDSYISDLNYSSKKQTYFITEQKFDLPPSLISCQNTSNCKTIFQSNPQHNKFYWGKTELIHFKNSKKQEVKGVLHYPADYDPQKKYPMIVSIYEEQSRDLHIYKNPTSYNAAGINSTVFTTQGYFFFLPDIIHESENAGPSSFDCVTAGTQKVIDMGLVDSKKIALLGHSFGGYETAFIINHTNMFAAAVASGAITDLRSYYLTVGWNHLKANMWRFATEEWRLKGKTPFENPTDFDRNSPLESILKLDTPLLMWTGKEDTQVDWHQSIEYYLALRRLEKKSILLLYPGENHVLSNPVNQNDIFERVLQWMDYYLKDEKKYTWISKAMK